MLYKKDISYLNILACLSFVFLHTNGMFLIFSKVQYWITDNVIENVFYFSVLIFIMISGVILIDYRDRCGTNIYIKRISKTEFPFIFWLLMAIMFSCFFGEISSTDITLIDIINWIYYALYFDIYWFFSSFLQFI